MGAVKRDVGRVKLIRPAELAICVVVALVLGVVFDRVDAFENFATFLEAHEEWQLDELFFIIFFPPSFDNAAEGTMCAKYGLIFSVG